VGRGLELHLCREHPLRRPRPTDRFVPFSERSHFEFDRQHTLEAVWKLDVRVVVRKVELSDRPWINDRHRGRGSMSPEIGRRQSFHTASVGSRLAAVGDLKRLNVGRRGHLSFEDGGFERPLHLRHLPLNTCQPGRALRTTPRDRGSDCARPGEACCAQLTEQLAHSGKG